MPLHKFNNPGLVYYKALSKYLELVQAIPEVVEVRLSEDDTLCTIISATPHDDEPCYRVFEAQEAVMRGVKQQPFLFDLVNRRELPEGGQNERIGSLGSPVWQREAIPEPAEREEEIVKTSKLNNPGLVYYQAMSKYLDLVKEIPEVIEVRLSEDDELYAIISAPPYDDGPCYRVYGVEGKVMDSVNPQPYRFRLVNAQKLPLEGRDDHISSFGDLVWKR